MKVIYTETYTLELDERQIKKDIVEEGSEDDYNIYDVKELQQYVQDCIEDNIDYFLDKDYTYKYKIIFKEDD